jgi:AraC-like DNA-binding protein
MQAGRFTVVPSGVYHDQANAADTTTLCVGIAESGPGELQSAWSDADGRITVGELADQLYVSKEYLRHLFFEHSSLSPLRHIIATKVEKAKALLVTSNLTV